MIRALESERGPTAELGEHTLAGLQSVVMKAA